MASELKILVCIAAVLATHQTASRSLAQEAGSEQVAAIETIYSSLFDNADTPVSSEAGQQALDKIEGLKLSESELEKPAWAKLLACKTLGFLAVGNARDAAATFELMQKAQPDSPDVPRLGYLVAMAAGDAKLGLASTRRRSSDKEPTKPDNDDSGATNSGERTRRVRTLGLRAPEQRVKAEDGTEVQLVPRNGRPLVVFLWNLRKKPTDEQVAAMKRQYDLFKEGDKVDFLTVSANSPGQADDAKSFVEKAGLTWKYHFEPKPAGAPVTHKAFKAGSSPMQVVVDADGIVRAVGEIGEPAVEYTLRAALAEAQGTAKPPDSRTADGKLAARQPQEPRAASGEGHREAGRDARRDVRRGDPRQAETDEDPPREREQQRPGQLRDDPDAEAKLRQARLYNRTGKKEEARRLFQEIVDNYPGTRQAKEAQEYLGHQPIRVSPRLP